MDRTNLAQLVYDMVHTVLSSADIKAICKSRGFSDKEANSRSLFENAFLSAVGVQAAMSTLTASEIVTLHLLKLENRTVDVSFFERIYGTTKTGTLGYGTFNQQFKPIFDSVQSRLVRKGLLLFSEAKTSALNKTKMELWRYRFPAEFAEYLPSPFPASIHTNEIGEMRVDGFRHELLAMVKRTEQPKIFPGFATLRDGTIYVGQKLFTVEAVQEWQQTRWEASLRTVGTGNVVQHSQLVSPFQGMMLPTTEYRSPTPLPFVSYALLLLKSNEWVTADQFDTLLDVFYGHKAHPTSALLCEAGYSNGCLARYQAKGKDYFRLPTARHVPPKVSPESYFKTLPDGNLAIMYGQIPYQALEVLNRGTYLEAEQGNLKVLPNLNKLLDTPEDMRGHAVMDYLQTHNPAFKAAFKKLDIEWGKTILHENLLVARVTDLGLRLQLQKAFASSEEKEGARIVVLPGEYIAFPRAMLGEVEKVVKKAGHIVKTVQGK